MTNTSKVELSGPQGGPIEVQHAARWRIAAKLDAIANHRTAALPAPAERPMIDVTATLSNAERGAGRTAAG